MSRFNPKPEHVDFFRVTTAAAVYYVYRRKLCACGRQITERQLKQSGQCGQCLKVKK